MQHTKIGDASSNTFLATLCLNKKRKGKVVVVLVRVYRFLRSSMPTIATAMIMAIAAAIMAV